MNKPNEELVESCGCCLVLTIIPIVLPGICLCSAWYKTMDLIRNTRIKSNIKKILPKYQDICFYKDKNILFGYKVNNITVVYLDKQIAIPNTIATQVVKRCYFDDQSFMFIVTDPFMIEQLIWPQEDLPTKTIFVNVDGLNLGNICISMMNYYGPMGKRFTILGNMPSTGILKP